MRRPTVTRRDLAVGFGREWKRVLAPDGDLWLMIGDCHDGGEWAGMDALVIGWLRRTGWRLQSRGFWVQIRSQERWDNRVNYLLRFRKVGQVVRPRGTTLCWTLPLPRVADRHITAEDLYKLKLWRESEPEAPDGLEVLQELKAVAPELPVIMVTAVKTIRTTVAAMELVARDYHSCRTPDAHIPLAVFRFMPRLFK